MYVIPGALTDMSNTPHAFIDPQERNAWYFSLQDEWQLHQKWTLTSGIRYDHYSDFGSTINPRLALVWQTAPELTSKILFGSAFHTPSFAQLYAKNNPVTLGNAQLEPEKLQSTELAFDYRPSERWRHKINTYYYRAKQLIVFVPQANNSSKAHNNASQNGYGVELESQWHPVHNLQLSSAFSWQHAYNADNETVPSAPGRQLSLSFRWQPQTDLSLYGSANWVMDRARAPLDSREPIKDYALLNFNVEKRLSSQWLISGIVRNLLNTQVREPDDKGKIQEDYPMEKRQLFVSLRYQMQE